MAYNRMCEEFIKRGCALLSTEQEISGMTGNKNVRYIANCGHEHNVFYNVFIHRGTGIICPRCKQQENTKKVKGDTSRTLDGQSTFMKMEDDAIIYIKQCISKDFVIHKTDEGCLTDLVVKPKSVEEDKWLGIQVKTTAKPSKDYGFKCNGRYKDMIIWCVCLSDKRMWLFDGNAITTQNKITIGLQNSKYDGNEMTAANSSTIITNCYTTSLLKHYVELNTPISPAQKTEQKFKHIRENKLKDLITFQYSEYSGLAYDFMVNGLKIQEKVGARSSHKSTISWPMFKNNGRDNTVRQFRQYMKDEVDLFWLHAPCGNLFYIVPSTVLYVEGIITHNISEGKKYLCCSPMNEAHWLNRYKFRYDNLNKEQLVNMLKQTNSTFETECQNICANIVSRILKNVIKANPPSLKCPYCMEPITYAAKACLKCSHKQKFECRKNRKVLDRPSYEQLIQDKLTMTYDQVSEKYGVAPSTIRQ